MAGPLRMVGELGKYPNGFPGKQERHSARYSYLLGIISYYLNELCALDSRDSDTRTRTHNL